jgi:hypothetical protein
MNDAVPVWNREDVELFVDGHFIGTAHLVRADVSRAELWVDGLDPLSSIFFSALIGPGGGDGTPIGRLGLRETRQGRTLDVAAARVVDFSSGTHHVSIAATHIQDGASVPAAP